MKKIVSLLYVLCCCLSMQYFSHMHARQIVKNRMAWIVQEEVHGSTFTNKVHVKEGARVQEWFIDGKSVTQSDYEEAILDAEKEERRIERQEDQQKRQQEYEFKYNAQCAVAKKLLKKSIDKIESDIRQINDYSLQPYFVYSDDTIISHYDYMKLVDTIIPQAKLLLTADTCIFDEQEEEGLDNSSEVDQVEPVIQKVIEQTRELDSYVDRVHAFFRATVNNAIDKCDDTKILKDLLALVSG